MLRPDLPDAVCGELAEQAKCLTCGYSLHGLQVFRCPECGRPFDLADLSSFRADHTRSVRVVATTEPLVNICWRVIVMLTLTVLWGGSAWIGGAWIALPAAIAMAVVLLAMSLAILVVGMSTRRYAIIEMPRRRTSLRLLWLFSLANLYFPVTVAIEIGTPLSPVGRAIDRLYTQTPAVEAASTQTWVGPIPVGPGELRDGVFVVQLGAGFHVMVDDGDRGAVRAFPVPFWVR